MAIIYVASVLVGMPAISSEFSPDTADYLELSPFRQPVYGMWANAAFTLLGSWEAVKVSQIAGFAACGAWVAIELAMISSLGVFAALLFVAMIVALGRLGLLVLVGSLISEGLFFPMLLLMMAMLLAWLRSRRDAFLIGLVLLMVVMTQVRDAAVLIVAVPLFAAIWTAGLQRRRSTGDLGGILTIGVLVIALALVPLLLGKSVFQLRPAGDRMGFVLLPRVALLPVPERIGERSPDWATMSSSWRSAASKMNPAAMTQFDAQLQEAIRFELGPKVLLPAILNRGPHEIEAGWAQGVYYADAKRIALDWIIDEWPTYLRLSGWHLWGMLTMSNYMNNASREQVWTALRSVSALTWRDAQFRTDYPLYRIYERLSRQTSLLYFLIRASSVCILILGACGTVKILRQTILDREFSPGSLAVVLAVGWSIAHSLPAALTVFPDSRFTYANMLVMFTGGLAWLAYLGLEQYQTR
jgi:hypothetical protein